MSQSPDPHDAGAASGREATSSPPLSFDAEILALLPQLRRYSRSLTRSDAESEDLLQDCVEKALSHRAQWHGANIRAWAYRIMTNLHLNARRAVARHPSVGIEAAESVAEGAPPSDPLARNRLVRALDALPKEARAVLMLVAVEGHTYQEVAEILDVPIGTVMSRLSRARQMLREKLLAENVIHLRSPR
jgi:RNA polymerase sigma-70 factor (ECF subfamily)